MSKRTITVLPGDGIGPAIVESTIRVLDALDSGFEYEFVDAGIAAVEKGKELIPEETLASIEKNQIALKGPITTPVGEGFTSINVSLRKKFDLYANVRPAKSIPGTLSRYEGVDIVTIRENTEGMYSGLGQKVEEGGTRAEAVSVVTQLGSERVLRFAYELAVREGRKHVTVVHKANIMKSTSGLFLRLAREIAHEYPQIDSGEMIVDNASMQLVMDPDQFDVIVTTNLFGDILSDLCAGLIGGLGLAPGANIGMDAAIFEAVHGSAPDIAGKNIANPTALMLAGAMMLDHLEMQEKAQRLRDAIFDAIGNGHVKTGDLGGSASTTEFTDAILSRL